MNGLLCYFSGTGNTKWIADRLSRELLAHDHHVQLVNIEAPISLDFSAQDFLIIGTPVHAELAPVIVEEFVAKLPTNRTITKCLVYSTQGAQSAAAGDLLTRVLTGKGYPVTMAVAVQMPNNYYFGAGIKPSSEKIHRYLTAAEERVGRLAAAFAAGEKQFSGSTRFRIALSKIGAHAFRLMLPRLATKLNTSDQCTGCGQCARSCPSRNIRIEGTRAVFGRDCLMCTRCIHLCPVNAIRYGAKQVEQTQRTIIGVLDAPDNQQKS